MREEKGRAKRNPWNIGVVLKLPLGRLKGYATVRVRPPTLGWLLGSRALVVPLKHRQLSTPLRSSFSLFAGRGSRDRRTETDDRAVSAPEIIAFDPVFFFIKYNTRERWRDTFRRDDALSIEFQSLLVLLSCLYSNVVKTKSRCSCYGYDR